MGICASCLGLNRHPSQDPSETDPFLVDSEPQYGAIGDDGVAEPDPEELRREREALDLICAQASDNMIDVVHYSTADLKSLVTTTNADQEHTRQRSDSTASRDAQEEEEEAAWLGSVQTADAELITEVKGLRPGALVFDLRKLKEEPQTLSGRKAMKVAVR